MFIDIRKVTKIFSNGASQTPVLRGISLGIEEGEFLCLLGPSGCGKSTLMSIMGGFERPTSGEVLIQGRQVSGPSPGYVTVFQNYGLLPWRTVEKNIQLGLEGRKMGHREMGHAVSQHIEMVGLQGFEKHHPHQLSGGMQQRVAIARALAVDPQVIFMDEPFGSLDALTRMKMQEVITGIWQLRKKTVVFITHDLEEAVYLADRIAVMTLNPGEIKTIIPVPLARERDRTGTDFVRVREEVFSHFEEKQADKVEYYL